MDFGVHLALLLDCYLLLHLWGAFFREIMASLLSKKMGQFIKNIRPTCRWH